MLFNLREQDWDEELLELLDIPRACLPRVVDTAGMIGMLDPAILGCRIPVTAMAGDQHASLFGQACLKTGDVKNTYGTGCFMLMNTGEIPVESQNGLLTTMAWRIGGKPTYALEGSVFMGGATIQWLRDELKIISTAAESEALALSVNGTGGVYLVPAFTGLGAPWWDMYSRGTLIGMTRDTGRPHIVRAALEAIAYQSADLMEAMVKDAGHRPGRLQVDGGASANAFLMQFQADICGIPVVRPKVLETTALGAALLAGLGAGVFATPGETTRAWKQDLEFTPRMDEATRLLEMNGWHRAVERSLGFAKA
jgi:glycerol kinase